MIVEASVKSLPAPRNFFRYCLTKSSNVEIKPASTKVHKQGRSKANLLVPVAQDKIRETVKVCKQKSLRIVSNSFSTTSAFHSKFRTPIYQQVTLQRYQMDKDE